MALEASTKKIILISLAIVALLGLAYLIYRLTKSDAVAPGTPPGSTTTTTPGIFDQVTSGFCKAFPKLCGKGGNGDLPIKCVDGCDQNHYGRDCNGFLDPSNCGAGRVQG